jgi:hypothetical protein
MFWPLLAGAEPPRLSLPLACSPGETCWVVSYVDLDPSTRVRDYGCGDATSDGHKGTDFAIRDKEAMRLGVPVVAAAAGVVAGVRDGMKDGDFQEPGGAERIRGKECGNGVNISHGDGWSTVYCQMQRNTIRVKKGDKVEAGTRLGLVGESGDAPFPQLRFQVMHGKEAVDPFLGAGRKEGESCGPARTHLWTQETLAGLPYRPTAFYSAGFAPGEPKTAGVRAGLYHDGVLPPQAPALVFWVDIFNPRAGDRLTIVITGPDGEELIRHGNKLDQDQSRRLAFAGVKRKGFSWTEGTYVGEALLERKGIPDLRVKREVVVK